MLGKPPTLDPSMEDGAIAAPLPTPPVVGRVPAAAELPPRPRERAVSAEPPPRPRERAVGAEKPSAQRSSFSLTHSVGYNTEFRKSCNNHVRADSLDGLWNLNCKIFHVNSEISTMS